VSEYRFECVNHQTGEVWFQGVSCTQQHPCPICRKPTTRREGYCVIDQQRGLVWCGHSVQSGLKSFYKIDGQHSPPPASVRMKKRPVIDFTAMHEMMRSEISPANLRAEAQSLGVSTQALRAVGIGWCSEHCAATFPMYSLHRKIVGLRVRRRSGYKFAIDGSTNAVFIPTGKFAPAGQDEQGRCVIVEGPTDTAAAIDLGLPVFGLPSALVAHDVIAHYVKGRDTVVIRDNDSDGLKSSDRLAAILVPICPTVRVIHPMQVKDLRKWKQAGATRELFEAVARNAAPVKRSHK